MHSPGIGTQKRARQSQGKRDHEEKVLKESAGERWRGWAIRREEESERGRHASSWKEGGGQFFQLRDLEGSASEDISERGGLRSNQPTEATNRRRAGAKKKLGESEIRHLSRGFSLLWASHSVLSALVSKKKKHETGSNEKSRKRNKRERHVK